MGGRHNGWNARSHVKNGSHVLRMGEPNYGEDDNFVESVLLLLAILHEDKVIICLNTVFESLLPTTKHISFLMDTFYIFSLK
jgi:hypothetical protein